MIEDQQPPCLRASVVNRIFRCKMKLNFWQWLGVVLLIVGVAVWICDKNYRNKPATMTTTTTPGQ